MAQSERRRGVAGGLLQSRSGQVRGAKALGGALEVGAGASWALVGGGEVPSHLD